jgi:hypothetical protein
VRSGADAAAAELAFVAASGAVEVVEDAGTRRVPPTSIKSGRPGEQPVGPAGGQVPWERVATVKQGPQILPSGQLALVLPALRPQRPQRTVPLLRGRPRTVLRGVSPWGSWR